MIDPLDFENRPLIGRLHAQRRFAALALLAESAGSALWRIVSWTAFFAGLWLIQIPSIFGGLGPEIFSVCYFIGLIGLMRRDLPRLRFPDKDAIDRRLEQESGLAHRPVSALEDRLANPQKEPTRHLWLENRRKALSLLSRLKRARFRPVLAFADPSALRILALVTLAAGLVIAGPQWPERIRQGMFPFSMEWAQPDKEKITLWINPPAYTGLGQITIQGGGKAQSVGIPEGSIIKARVAGGFIRPVLSVGDKDTSLARVDDKNWAGETGAAKGDKIALSQLPFARLVLPYNYIADQPPEIALKEAPKELPKGQMQLQVAVKDDYSVKDLSMVMTLDPALAQDPPLGMPVEDKRAVMSQPGEELPLQPVYDLAWHPWAGQQVVIVMSVEDHPGHITALPPLRMTLPEREFLHPAARQIVNMRKRLIWTPLAAMENVGYELETLMSDLNAYNGDVVVFLSLRSASSRLLRNPGDEKSARDVIAQLWDTALRVEDGNLSLAARNLRDAQRALEKLLSDPNATQEDIAEAMDALRDAMAEYFQELAREMQKRMANGEQMPQIPPEMMNQNFSAEDLAAFMDMLQSQALSGDKDAAREMLSQLEQMMNMLDPSMSFQMPPDMQFMMESRNAMQELIQKQQQLLDQTQGQADSGKAIEQQTYPQATPDMTAPPDWAQQEDMPPPPQQNARKPDDGKTPEINTQGNKAEQDALRYVLGQLMLEADEKLGHIPEKMQSAEQQMRGSADKLGRNDPEGAIPHQQQAIKDLQDAMSDMSQQLAKRMQQMTVMSFGPGQLDPLGRPMQDGEGKNNFGSKVKIPDEAQRKRVQDILKTLRKRSGELDRPDYELEYFRRLMKQF